jgi:protease-4
MRNFLSSLLGGLAALVIFFTGLCFFGLVFIIVLASQGGKERTTQVEQGAYLVLKLDANVLDAPPQIDLRDLGAGVNDSYQLRQLTTILRSAATDSRIGGLFLTGTFTPAEYGCSFAALKELRQAVAAFRASGKPVVAYLNEADTRGYYVASAASDVILDPYGAVVLPGLAARPMFYTGAFEKFGIGVQVTRVGKYKSAVEPYTRKDLSPENRQQLSLLLNDIWSDLLADIAASRKVAVPSIQKLVDEQVLINGENALSSGLVDRVLYRDQVIEELKGKTGRKGSKDSFRQIAFDDYIKAAKAGPAKTGKGRVAVVYAEGAIVDGDGARGQIGGDKFARELRRLRQDENVKAIVLRVNSPGGSATASEHIQRELRLAREVKPVIVSMGGYAASGGYWISAYGSRIFAEPTTITGSIGVFGLYFDVEKLAGNLGLSFDTVKTGRHADVFTLTRPKTDAELAVMQHFVDWIYEQFISKVAEGRKLDKAAVMEMAQGRVWSGTQALKLGLVDEIGGLDAAIRQAGKDAGMGDNPAIQEFPAKKELAEVLAELFEKIQPVNSRAPDLLARLKAQLETELSVLRSCNDPHGVYARLPGDLRLE